MKSGQIHICVDVFADSEMPGYQQKSLSICFVACDILYSTLQLCLYCNACKQRRSTLYVERDPHYDWLEDVSIMDVKVVVTWFMILNKMRDFCIVLSDVLFLSPWLSLVRHGSRNPIVRSKSGHSSTGLFVDITACCRFRQRIGGAACRRKQ